MSEGDDGKAGRGQVVGASVGQGYAIGNGEPSRHFWKRRNTSSCHHLEFGVAKDWDGTGPGFGAGRPGSAFQLHRWLAV